MKVIEVLNFNKELLNKIRSTGIRLDDCRYIDLYGEYQTLYIQGEKMTYIATFLSEKYGISERKFYSLVKRFNSNCKSLAVQ
jgi:hypothetical protein